VNSDASVIVGIQLLNVGMRRPRDRNVSSTTRSLLTCRRLEVIVTTRRNLATDILLVIRCLAVVTSSRSGSPVGAVGLWIDSGHWQRAGVVAADAAVAGLTSPHAQKAAPVGDVVAKIDG